MLPSFDELRTVALYAPDLQRAVTVYEAFGLEVGRPAQAADTGSEAVTLRFPKGGTELTLHSDPQRQFIELQARVGDVRAAYRQLLQQPDLVWLELPHRIGDDWRAVVRLPDENVFTLLSPVHTPASTAAVRT